MSAADTQLRPAKPFWAAARVVCFYAASALICHGYHYANMKVGGVLSRLGVRSFWLIFGSIAAAGLVGCALAGLGAWRAYCWTQRRFTSAALIAVGGVLVMTELAITAWTLFALLVFLSWRMD